MCAKEEGSVGLLDGIVGTVDLVVTGVVNTGVDIVAGGAGLVTLAISGGDVDAAVHTIESVQEKQIGLLSQAGEKVAGVVAPVVDKYYEQNMAALGDATLETTGSPLLAMAAHKSVELVGTVLGAGVVGKSLKNGAKVDGVVPNNTPIVTSLNRADLEQQLIARLGQDIKGNPLRQEYEAKVAELARYQ